jgi:hypothetical protein
MACLRAAVIVVTVLLVPLHSWGEDRAWAKKLSSDIVRVADGKLIYEDVTLCAVNAAGGKKNVQIMSRAEAPATGVLSRDQFVAKIIQYETILLLGLAAAGQNKLRCRTLDEPIGVPDLELTMTMTKDGLQYEVLNPATKQVNRVVSTWDELVPE